jgi:predicted nucleic acid-binding protein
MTRVFADAFYWLAVLNVNDSFHAQAAVLSRQVAGWIVTSQAVLIEVMDALCRPPYRTLAYRFWREVSQDRGVVIVGFEPDAVERAASMFLTRADKPWSMTDCLSFVIMADRGITEALTGDRHFQQAGFRTLF